MSGWGAPTTSRRNHPGVGLRSYSEPWLDTTSPFGEALYYITVAYAQLERGTLRKWVQISLLHGGEVGTGWRYASMALLWPEAPLPTSASEGPGVGGGVVYLGRGEISSIPHATQNQHPTIAKRYCGMACTRLYRSNQLYSICHRNSDSNDCSNDPCTYSKPSHAPSLHPSRDQHMNGGRYAHQANRSNHPEY